MGDILSLALTELHKVIQTRKGNALRTISLYDVLGFESTDAPYYTICNRCYKSWGGGDEPKCLHQRAWRPGYTVADTIDCKMRDGQFRELVKSCDTHGIATPVMIIPGDRFGGPRVINGHHRIAYAYLRNLSTIPYVSDWEAYDVAEYSSDDETGWMEGSRACGYYDQSRDYVSR